MEKTDEESEFLCEYRLKRLNPDLHLRYKNSVFSMDRLLANYKAVFPYFTNHTFEHSAQVINYCNLIMGAQNAEKLNADELYILLMGAALHDVGMGISVRDFENLKENIKGLKKYEQTHLMCSVGEVTRTFHNEFGAEFLKKYYSLFEIPDSSYLYCICQIIRGHRKVDLFDENEYGDCVLSNGNKVRLRYIAALVRLADELDITSNRNLFFDYSNKNANWSQKQTMCFKCHEAIKSLEARGKSLVLKFATEDGAVYNEIMNTKNKVLETFNLFVSVVNAQADFVLGQQDVYFECIV